MKAQARIIKGGLAEKWHEKCICGSPEITIDEKMPEYARCYQCLRVYTAKRIRGSLRWAICYDPYLVEGPAGAFMKMIGCFPYDICPEG